MSVETTMSRLATVWQNFSVDASGQHIEKVFDKIPRVIHPAHLPAVLIFPQPAVYDYDDYGETIIAETRIYRCVVAASQATLGNIETGETFVEPYFGKVRNYFAARPGLEDDNAAEPQEVVCQSRPLGDGGYFIFEYPSSSDAGTDFFHATDFQFEVKELVSITYKD